MTDRLPVMENPWLYLPARLQLLKRVAVSEDESADHCARLLLLYRQLASVHGPGFPTYERAVDLLLHPGDPVECVGL